MLRGNIAATLLKILLEDLFSVKGYDKSNMNVFTLSLWENFRWGLIYFDQFILLMEIFFQILFVWQENDLVLSSEFEKIALQKTPK